MTIAALGTEILVSTAFIQMYPQITTLADGGFAVTWWSTDDGTNGEVRGRVFAADGTPVNGSDFLVSTTNAYGQMQPQITALADGGFAVTWISNDKGDYDVRGRVFAADGTPVNGSDFLVSTTIAYNQLGSPITALADGGFAVTWQSFDSMGNYYIRAQVFGVNEVPAVTAPGGLATDEDTALVINGFTVDDPDNSQLTVTLTATSKLTLSQTDGLTFTDGDGTADQKMTFSGAIADINAALAGMTYAPTADFNGTGGFDYTLDDGIDQVSGSVGIKVDAVNDAPRITLNGSGAAASVSVAENTTAVTTVTATDPDAGQTMNYSISGGADASKFVINAGTGALSFITAPNFEAPTDAGHNNVYDVTVQVSDGAGGIDTQALSVSVQNVSDPNAGILWQNSVVGTPALWLMDGLSPTTGSVLPNPGPAWHVVDAGDFNGDGNADIVWQGRDGTPAIWLMDDDKPVWVGAVGPFNPGPNWEIKGTGDFNGDGNDDILWQGRDGTPAVWMMDGTHVDWLGTVGPFNPGPNWEIKGTGDFNGDGRSDILWQGSDGTPAIWLMDGASAVSVGVAGSFNPGPSWEIKGTDDFNGDGRSDILWQGSNGTPAIWLMDGLSATDVAGLPNLGADWHIIA
jgi:hypothetical protein